METLSKRYPGVKRIGCIKASLLPPDLMLTAMTGVKVAIVNPVNWLDRVGESEFTIEDYYSYGTSEQKVTIAFNSRDAVYKSQKLAFIVTCVSGESYLVGTAEPNNPVVNCELYAGKKSGTAAVNKVTVTHTAQIAAIEVVL